MYWDNDLTESQIILPNLLASNILPLKNVKLTEFILRRHDANMIILVIYKRSVLRYFIQCTRS